MDCPCGRQREDRRLSFADCCGPFLRGETLPPDAESLMRSRFTAFTRGETAYLDATHRRAELGAEADVDASTRWLHLDIVDTVAGGPTDDRGEVEFIATFERGGRPARLRERSRFEKVGGRWLYVDGAPRVEAVDLRAVGRNDPCWCGSGKKRKACHR